MYLPDIPFGFPTPFITKRRTLQIIPNLRNAITNNVKIIVLTRPAEEYKGNDSISWQDTIELLRSNGITLILRSKIHQKFAILDRRVVWYGSINLFSYGNSEESMMRLESPNIAYELIKSTGYIADDH